MDLKEQIEKLISKKSLSEKEAQSVMESILAGDSEPLQVAALLIALRMNGETPEELSGFIAAMQNAMTPLEHNHAICIDTCGTGGDSMGSFNISTAAAFVVAGAGYKVAKHGNRSVSSRSGSADILETSGIRIDLDKTQAAQALDRIGMAFLFAPHYHPAMKNVVPIRRSLKIRTVFNFLGPLVNPARANAQVIGVPNAAVAELLAKSIKISRKKQKFCALIVNESGFDEWVLNGSAKLWEVSNGSVKKTVLTPQVIGLKKPVSLRDLAGGDAVENAKILKQFLEQKSCDGLTQVVLANAALAIAAAKRIQQKEKNIKFLIRYGYQEAAAALKSGAALKVFHELRQGLLV